MKKKWLLTLLTGLLLLSGCSLFEKETTDQKKDKPKSTEKQVSEKDVETNSDEIVLPATNFNETKLVDGKRTITNTDNLVQLVNKENYLPAHYKPTDLVTVPGVHFALPQNKEIHQMRKPASDAVVKMFADGKKAGLEFSLRSAFRSYETQEMLFANEVKKVGEEEASKWVAIPGTSEHQTGLTLDLTSKSNGYQLGEKFEKTAEFAWLMDNAYKYGFILRYPKGEDKVTGYYYEPWHWRYVGVDVATDMVKRGIVNLEDYIAQAKSE